MQFASTFYRRGLCAVANFVFRAVCSVQNDPASVQTIPVQIIPVQTKRAAA
jgi:hypothetical protein